MTHPTWTCITGEVGEDTAEDTYYWEGDLDAYYEDPDYCGGGGDEYKTSKHECPHCGWKFRGDSYWGSSYGDTCPNCRTLAHEGDDYGDEGCFSPRD